ncbi:MAG: indolepyruvate ferredoxin oxidoreductase family protein [Arenicellales bacterium]
MLRNVSLEDKYDLAKDRAYITGIEALVRLPLLQHQKDLEAGLNTAGFVSGYRGSPVGTVDQAMWRAQDKLLEHNINFKPGVNEDLAATAVWGTQQVHLLPGPKYDGVFAMWYGKGPGVDRSMDVIKHANMFGTTANGGVLAVAGDDHACKSSTVPHQSDHNFIGAAVPVLNPANVQDVLDYGLYGWALSRYSGCWVGLKAITENMDSAISADLSPDRIQICVPADFDMPEGGLNAQWPTTPLEQERLLHKYRIYAARSFAYANRLNRVALDSPNPRLGIVTTGKSYLDVLEALRDLGIDQDTASEIGIRIYKVGMSWPLEPIATHEFAKGLSEILVVEEKRSILEDQITGQLYNWPVSDRPRVVGEFDEEGSDLVTNLSELTPAMVARAIGSRVLKFYDSASIQDRLAFLDAKEARLKKAPAPLTRTPYFCSGCPHNTSTRVPEGSIGLAGIGCHYMVKWMDRNTELFTQMGGEGASWIGQAPFTETKHVFQNIGDGTYFHSGILAIRAAIAAGVNITYKILYNDAVAMTGGQPVDGTLTLERVVAQVRAEGVKRIAVVAEDTNRARVQLQNYSDITLHPKVDFDQLQHEMREVEGTSVIVFDQTCASEKRRRRKRGLMPESDTRVYINPDVCEGCGDCSTKSNCLSVIPKKTELGLKRQIDQNACNKDFSCLEGFCPSFVTVTGGKLKSVSSEQRRAELEIVLREPTRPKLDRPWNILVTGIGGTGVLTVGSVLAMAAHIEGKGCATLNQTGLAQKFGSVVSHVKIAASQNDIHAVRIADGDADLLLGCDLVVSAGNEALARLDPERSHAIVNSYETATADFIHDREYSFPAQQLRDAIRTETGDDQAEFVDATRIARDLLGDTIASNMFLVGFAYQNGLVPVSAEAINQAIGLNGVALQLNKSAFLWGRRAAVNLEAVLSQIGEDKSSRKILTEPEDIINWRYDYLVQYQNQAWAERYVELVNTVQTAEPEGSGQALTLAVAKNAFRLMSYKDEYEVGRLYSDGRFIESLNAQFEGQFKINYHLAPPFLAKRNNFTGLPMKRVLPGFTITVFKLLGRLKGLRGKPFDLFGRTDERRTERTLINEYHELVGQLLTELNSDNYEKIVEIAALADMVKGFGHVKMANIQRYRERLAVLKRKLVEPELAVVVNG